MQMSESALDFDCQLKRRFLTTDPHWIERFGDPFRPLDPACEVVQFDSPLTQDQLRRAGALVANRPDVELYVYSKASRDLDFLQYFPKLRRLHIALYELEAIGGFAHLAGGLERLVFGQTKRTFSLGFLARMPRLVDLYLVRHKKDLPAVRGMSQLTSLGLSGVTLPDLSLLLPLKKLQRFSNYLGGTRNIGILSDLPLLEELVLMRITKMSDLGVLGDCVALRKMRLDWMRNVTSLPTFSRLDRLEDVTLDTMKGLTDLSALAAAPALRQLSISAMPQLMVESFRCLVGHPRLEQLWAYTGKTSVNEAVKIMFPGIAR
jgi:internalin A